MPDLAEYITVEQDRLPFIDAGYGFLFNLRRITAIFPYKGLAPRRLYESKRDKGLIFDCTRGRKKRSLIVFDTGEIALSAFTPDTLVTNKT